MGFFFLFVERVFFFCAFINVFVCFWGRVFRRYFTRARESAFVVFLGGSCIFYLFVGSFGLDCLFFFYFGFWLYRGEDLFLGDTG